MAYSSGQAVAIACVFSVLPIVVVTMRFMSRRLSSAKCGIDDWLILPALVCCVGAGIGMIVGATKGSVGQHQELGPYGKPLNNAKLQTFEKFKYVDEILELLAYGTAKLSVIFLYRRIFANKTFRHVTTVALVIVAAWIVSFFFVIIFQCAPIASQWENLEIMNQENCVHLLSFYYGNSITDLLTDVMVLVLPLPMIARLQMPLKQKMAVAGMFLLGTLVCVTSAVRLGVFLTLLPEFPKHLSDITYYQAPLGYWSFIEGSLSVVSACLPTLRPLFSHSRRKKTSYVHPSTRSGADASKRGEPKLEDVDLEDKPYYLSDGPDKPGAPATPSASADSESPIHSPHPVQWRDEGGQQRVTPSPTLVGNDEDVTKRSQKSLSPLKPGSPTLLTASPRPTKMKRDYAPPPPSPTLASPACRSPTFNPRIVTDTYSPIFSPALQYPRPAPPVPDYVRIREEAAASVTAPQLRPWFARGNKGTSMTATRSKRGPKTAREKVGTTTERRDTSRRRGTMDNNPNGLPLPSNYRKPNVSDGPSISSRKTPPNVSTTVDRRIAPTEAKDPSPPLSSTNIPSPISSPSLDSTTSAKDSTDGEEDAERVVPPARLGGIRKPKKVVVVVPWNSNTPPRRFRLGSRAESAGNQNRPEMEARMGWGD